jgi:protein CWC15
MCVFFVFFMNGGYDEPNSSDGSGYGTSSDESDSDTDEALALERELARIRAERAEASRAEDEARAREAEARAVAGNPLLATGSGARRRWDEDVVFRNQTRAGGNRYGIDDEDVVNGSKRFINDTTRSDFHRRFMQKYMK